MCRPWAATRSQGLSLVTISLPAQRSCVRKNRTHGSHPTHRREIRVSFVESPANDRGWSEMETKC